MPIKNKALYVEAAGGMKSLPKHVRQNLRDKLRCSPVALHQDIILCIPLDHHFWQRFMAIAPAFAAKHVVFPARLHPHRAPLQHILVPAVDIADGFWLKSPFAQKNQQMLHRGNNT
jgi:hypothetical protein